MIDSSEPRHEFFQVEDVKIFLDGGPSEVQKWFDVWLDQMQNTRDRNLLNIQR